MEIHPLYKVLKKLESEEEFLELLEITFTEKEREMMLERWRIFSAIDKGLSSEKLPNKQNAVWQLRLVGRKLSGKTKTKSKNGWRLCVKRKIDLRIR